MGEPGVSGGSFNYLYANDPGEILGSDELREMAEELEALGHVASEPAKLTRALVDESRALEDRIEKLRPVWFAVEWWKSCDWSRDQMLVALGRWLEKQA